MLERLLHIREAPVRIAQAVRTAEEAAADGAADAPLAAVALARALARDGRARSHREACLLGLVHREPVAYAVVGEAEGQQLVGLVKTGRVAILTEKPVPEKEAIKVANFIMIDADGISKSFESRPIIDPFSTRILRGDRVWFVPGWDCHGLPIELKVLQSIKSKERSKLSPVDLRKRAAEFARETAEPAILRVPRRGNSEVASLDPGIAAKCRRLGGCAEIRVPTTTCLALIREHGLPTVLKVDIEGLDRACVESLAADPAARPRYVMIEDKSAMDLLTSLGYTRFKLQHGYSVAQARVAPRARGGAPWEVINAATGTLAWSTAEEINAALARGLRRQPHDLYAALTEPHADEAEFMRVVAE